VPGANWIEESIAFVQQTANQPRAAVFAADTRGFIAWLDSVFSPLPRPDQGLILRRSLYDELGGHRMNASDPEAELLRRIGRRRLTTLHTIITKSSI
jgi:succinate dehydrogenase/fumarate reductase flavoprotein subunit